MMKYADFKLNMSCEEYKVYHTMSYHQKRQYESYYNSRLYRKMETFMQPSQWLAKTPRKKYKQTEGIMEFRDIAKELNLTLKQTLSYYYSALNKLRNRLNVETNTIGE